MAPPPPLPVWVKSTKWAPATEGGGSAGFPVECPATGDLGHGKPQYVWQEVLASLLADEIGVVVPKVRLGEHQGQVIAVSKLFGPKSLDIPALKAASPKDYASEALKKALRQASGALPFQAWVGNSDFKDAHVMVRGPKPKEFAVGCIDFAFSFQFDAAGEPAVAPQGPPVLIADEHREAEVIGQPVDRIEGLSDDRIREIVGGLPDAVFPTAEKDRVVKGLIARKSGLRAAFLHWITKPA